MPTAPDRAVGAALGAPAHARSRRLSPAVASPVCLRGGGRLRTPWCVERLADVIGLGCRPHRLIGLAAASSSSTPPLPLVCSGSSAAARPPPHPSPPPPPPPPATAPRPRRRRRSVGGQAPRGLLRGQLPLPSLLNCGLGHAPLVWEGGRPPPSEPRRRRRRHCASHRECILLATITMMMMMIHAPLCGTPYLCAPSWP